MKWGIISPFSFANNNWLPWLHSYGFTNTGKTTEGKIVRAMWRLDDSDYNKYFESINTSARFGQTISQIPISINEAGASSDDRRIDIVEMIKHTVESRNTRSKLIGRDKFRTIPELSPSITLNLFQRHIRRC